MISKDDGSLEESSDAVNISDQTYREMQKICKERGLPANGTTEAIRTRLVEDLTSPPTTASIELEAGAAESHVMDESKLPHNSGPQTPKKRIQTEQWSTSGGDEGGTTTSSSSLTLGAQADTSAEAKSQEEKITTPSRKKKLQKTKTSSSRKRPRIIPGSVDPPKNWEALYSIVEELRADRTAPLDSDGGEALPERNLGEKVYRFQVLVALMLSSQTKDAVVGDAMRALQSHGLTVENIHATESSVLNSLINKVGFHNNKTKYLKKVAEVLINEYDCDIPPTADEMIKKLSGVGPKMAYIIENVAFGKSTGIGVDTHMHRIFNNIKWVESTTPEQTREQLEGWLPKEKWIEINMLWVGFGQESQQQKSKILKKALSCSRPIEALYLLKKVGLDVTKEGKKFGLTDEINECLSNNKV
jgi:endonuclease-3